MKMGREVEETSSNLVNNVLSLAIKDCFAIELYLMEIGQLAGRPTKGLFAKALLPPALLHI